MYLSKISVRNFRNLESLEVNLSPGLNVIVGENNVGKTNLLDALRVALGSAWNNSDPVRLSKEDLHRSSDNNIKNESIKIDLIFSELSEEEQAQFLEILNYNPNSPEKSTANIHFEWSWNETNDRGYYRRWGGGRSNSETSISEDILQMLSITLLGALRDASSGLAPGRQNRLGRLLRVSAKDQDKTKLEEIIAKANDDLEQNQFVRSAEEKISKALKGASGPEFKQEAIIRSSEPEFDRIANNLRLVLKIGDLDSDTGKPITRELRSNGLGYNNLIYIATVLSELEVVAKAALPLLLVEEPEAHLHPQLQILLTKFFLERRIGNYETRDVQVIVTTHSPTIASYVPIEVLRVLHQERSGNLRCVCLGECELTKREAYQLRRMFDVTRATLLFARGVILVEGVTEAILIPVLSKRLGVKLDDEGVSVIPICGVEFSTISKLFGENKLKIPLSIITDGDPNTESENGAERHWSNEVPKRDDESNIEVCKRVLKLLAEFKNNSVVSVFSSKVTLEYDLADAGEKNPEIICQAWESCSNRPITLNLDKLKACGDNHEKRVLTIWRGICRANPSRGKGDLAQELAELLESNSESFIIPDYIKRAIYHVAGSPYESSCR